MFHTLHIHVALVLSVGALLFQGCNVSYAWNSETSLEDMTSANADAAPDDRHMTPPAVSASPLPQGHQAPNGVRHVRPMEVLPHIDRFHVVDVRETSELHGPLGHIDGIHHIPLGQLPARLGELPQDHPVLVVCRSGNRSGQACDRIRRQTGQDCWNLAGGMIGWNQVARAR